MMKLQNCPLKASIVALISSSVCVKVDCIERERQPKNLSVRACTKLIFDYVNVCE